MEGPYGDQISPEKTIGWFCGFGWGFGAASILFVILWLTGKIA